MGRRIVGAVLALGLVAPSVAAADDNDLVLSRLGTRITNPTTGALTGVVGQNLELRALASQLGVVLAPRMMTPADTIGFGGFQVTFDYATTTIDPSQAYWKAREASPDPAGAGGSAHGPSSLSTIGMFVRKGLFLPPSFEVGAGGVHLIDSNIWTGQLYAKVALHEGYRSLPIPSLAVRGAVSRMMSQRELDLTVVSLDVTASKHFGIGGTWRFDPYVGWNLLMIIPRSEVVDPTPNIDSQQMGNEIDSELNFVFREQDTILRHRILVGAKFQYYVLEFTVEAQFALKGSSIDDRGGTNEACMPESTTTTCDAKDTAAAQRTLSVSAGFDF